jgi:hypothetical protein
MASSAASIHILNVVLQLLAIHCLKVQARVPPRVVIQKSKLDHEKPVAA